MNRHSPQIRAPRRRRLTRRAATVAIAACGWVAGAGVVDARPLERGVFHESGSEVFDFCPGLEIVHTWDVSGSFLGIARGPDGLPHFRQAVRGTEGFTNVTTGRTYSGFFAVAEIDRDVTDNGDGTLTIQIQGSGGARWYDGDGKLVLRNPGMNRAEILVDHAGTPNDPFDDEFLEFLGVVKPSTGLNETEGRDFCEDVALFTA